MLLNRCFTNLNVPRIPPRLVRSYRFKDLTLDGPDRLKAFKDLTKRVNNKQECWAYQIQSLAFMISLEGNYGRTTPVEANNLMKACQLDIVDLFPADQKILTEIAWDAVKSAQMRG